MRMRRYQRNSADLSLSKFTSSIPSQSENIMQAQAYLQHFYLSKSQIYGKELQKKIKNGSNINKTGYRVINKQQENKIQQLWLRQKTKSKYQSNIASDYGKNSNSRVTFQENLLLHRLGKVRFESNDSFPKFISKRFVVKAVKNHQGKMLQSKPKQSRNIFGSFKQSESYFDAWQVREDI